jgi:hypothetical protein
MFLWGQPGEYLLWFGFKVALHTQREGLGGFELVLRIAHQDPAQGYTANKPVLYQQRSRGVVDTTALAPPREQLPGPHYYYYYYSVIFSCAVWPRPGA